MIQVSGYCSKVQPLQRISKHRISKFCDYGAIVLSERSTSVPDPLQFS